ncbi:MAG: HEAT repeat domain-containing protein, partial [Acidimicrobiales bacterium]
LLGDSSRAVRRATVDAVADADREELRPLLERALADDDGWVRWKALRGLNDLGPERSRDLIAGLSRDRDFRVRLEVTRAVSLPEPQ